MPSGSWGISLEAGALLVAAALVLAAGVAAAFRCASALARARAAVYSPRGPSLWTPSDVCGTHDRAVQMMQHSTERGRPRSAGDPLAGAGGREGFSEEGEDAVDGGGEEGPLEPGTLESAVSGVHRQVAQMRMRRIAERSKRARAVAAEAEQEASRVREATEMAVLSLDEKCASKPSLEKLKLDMEISYADRARETESLVGEHRAAVEATLSAQESAMERHSELVRSVYATRGSLGDMVEEAKRSGDEALASSIGQCASSAGEMAERIDRATSLVRRVGSDLDVAVADFLSKLADPERRDVERIASIQKEVSSEVGGALEEVAGLSGRVARLEESRDKVRTESIAFLESVAEMERERAARAGRVLDGVAEAARQCADRGEVEGLQRELEAARRMAEALESDIAAQRRQIDALARMVT